jgi:hypothetical protein
LNWVNDHFLPRRKELQNPVTAPQSVPKFCNPERDPPSPMLSPPPLTPCASKDPEVRNAASMAATEVAWTGDPSLPPVSFVPEPNPSDLHIPSLCGPLEVLEVTVHDVLLLDMNLDDEADVQYRDSLECFEF